jgi:hypothetical protein
MTRRVKFCCSQDSNFYVISMKLWSIRSTPRHGTFEAIARLPAYSTAAMRQTVARRRKISGQGPAS